MDRVVPHWDEHERRDQKFRPDRDNLENLLELNALLAAQPVPEHLCQPKPKKMPMVFVCGTPRSGTTMMLQLLVNAYRVTYPDNVIARFWGAPYYGVAVSRSLRDQMGGVAAVDYASVAGMTADTFGPHDFAYFWERFYPFGQNVFVSSEQIAASDEARLLTELTAMYRAGGAKPLVFRGILFTINVEHFSQLFEDALFVDMRRDLVDVCVSMLKNRMHRYGTEDIWWGSAPPERDELESLVPEAQVAGQAHHLRRRMDEGLSKVSSKRVIRVAYADACDSPAAVLDRIRQAADALGHNLHPRDDADIPERFDFNSGAESVGGRRSRLREYLDSFAKEPDAPLPRDMKAS